MATAVQVFSPFLEATTVSAPPHHIVGLIDSALSGGEALGANVKFQRYDLNSGFCGHGLDLEDGTGKFVSLGLYGGVDTHG